MHTPHHHKQCLLHTHTEQQPAAGFSFIKSIFFLDTQQNRPYTPPATAPTNISSKTKQAKLCCYFFLEEYCISKGRLPSNLYVNVKTFLLHQYNVIPQFTSLIIQGVVVVAGSLALWFRVLLEDKTKKLSSSTPKSSPPPPEEKSLFTHEKT